MCAEILRYARRSCSCAKLWKKCAYNRGADGVGKEIARGLARAGCTVLLVGRDSGKGMVAQRELRATTGNPNVYFLRADLSLMNEAARLADEVAHQFPALHYLVHSAGVVRGRHELTTENVESLYFLFV